MLSNLSTWNHAHDGLGPLRAMDHSRIQLILCKVFLHLYHIEYASLDEWMQDNFIALILSKLKKQSSPFWQINFFPSHLCHRTKYCIVASWEAEASTCSDVLLLPFQFGGAHKSPGVSGNRGVHRWRCIASTVLHASEGYRPLWSNSWGNWAYVCKHFLDTFLFLSVFFTNSWGLSVLCIIHLHHRVTV